MSALTFIVCAFTFITVSNIPVPLVSSLSVGSIKDGAVDIVEKVVNDGVRALENDLKKVVNISQYMTGDLNKTAIEIITKFKDTVKSEIKKMKEAAEDVINRAQGQNVTNCQKILATTIQYSYAVVDNVSLCVNGKLSEGYQYASNVTTDVYNALQDLLQIKSNIAKCKEGSGLIHAVKAPFCGSIITGDTVISVAAKVPAIGMNVAKLAKLAGSLDYTLPTCVARNAVSSIIDEIRAVAVTIKRCVGEKLLE